MSSLRQIICDVVLNIWTKPLILILQIIFASHVIFLIRIFNWQLFVNILFFDHIFLWIGIEIQSILKERTFVIHWNHVFNKWSIAHQLGVLIDKLKFSWMNNFTNLYFSSRIAASYLALGMLWRWYFLQFYLNFIGIFGSFVWLIINSIIAIVILFATLYVFFKTLLFLIIKSISYIISCKSILI